MLTLEYLRPLARIPVCRSAQRSVLQLIGASFLDDLAVKDSARNVADPVLGVHINAVEAFSSYVERARVGV